MVLLQAIDLLKRYGGRAVVNHVSFEVSPGETVGLLGRNGAGKTTSFRITIGMIRPNGGRVIFDGTDVTDMPMYKRANMGMGYLSQEPSVFQRLSVVENLLAFLENTSLPKPRRLARAEELMEQFGLTHLRNQQARFLSGGERRKLEIARALITNPTLILLDEPFSGVDPRTVEDLQQEIMKLKGQGIAILLTDHNVRETLAVTDRSYVIDEGVVIRQGTPRELINDPLVRKTYLGHTFRGDEFDAWHLPGLRHVSSRLRDERGPQRRGPVSETITRGLVFVDGTFILPPYTIAPYGRDFSINGLPVRPDYEAAAGDALPVDAAAMRVYLQQQLHRGAGVFVFSQAGSDRHRLHVLALEKAVRVVELMSGESRLNRLQAELTDLTGADFAAQLAAVRSRFTFGQPLREQLQRSRSTV